MTRTTKIVGGVVAGAVALGVGIYFWATRKPASSSGSGTATDDTPHPMTPATIPGKTIDGASAGIRAPGVKVL